MSMEKRKIGLPGAASLFIGKREGEGFRSATPLPKGWKEDQVDRTGPRTAREEGTRGKKDNVVCTWRGVKYSVGFKKSRKGKQAERKFGNPGNFLPLSFIKSGERKGAQLVKKGGRKSRGRRGRHK